MAQRLPENAYKELKPGEQYTPFVPANRVVEEVTTRSLVAGMLMCVLFSFAASYLGLKVGQVFEAGSVSERITMSLLDSSDREMGCEIDCPNLYCSGDFPFPAEPAHSGQRKRSGIARVRT